MPATRKMPGAGSPTPGARPSSGSPSDSGRKPRQMPGPGGSTPGARPSSGKGNMDSGHTALGPDREPTVGPCEDDVRRPSSGKKA